MEKLIQFQKKVEAIKKDSQNPFFKSNYFDINSLLKEIRPLLNELELVLIQPLTTIDGKPAISTIILDGDKELINSSIILPDLQDPQKMGSAITYYRRYSIQSLLLLQAEDDDGNSANGRDTKQDTKPVNYVRFLKTKLSSAKNLEQALDLLLHKTGVSIEKGEATKLEDLINNTTAKELLDFWQD